jgi:peroxiredoxin
MSRVGLNINAPNFTLSSVEGQKINLSDYQGNKNVLLVFNRGFG